MPGVAQVTHSYPTVYPRLFLNFELFAELPSVALEFQKYHPLGTLPMDSLKNVSQFSPALWQVIENINLTLLYRLKIPKSQ